MTIMNSSSEVGLDNSRNLTLREKKELQWAKERNESNNWYPFGTPGGGNPLRPPRKSRSLSGANLSSPQLVATGSNGPSSSGSPSSGANAPLPALQGGQYQLVSSLQHAYTLPNGQPATYTYTTFNPHEHQQNGYEPLLTAPQLLPPGYMYSPQSPQSPYVQHMPIHNGVPFPMQHNQLATHPTDPGSPLPPRSHILQPLVGPTTSTPINNTIAQPHERVTPAGSFAHDGSYTEQWANQLEQWQQPHHDANAQTPHVSKSRHSTGQPGSGISSYTLPPSMQPSMPAGMVHPSGAWMLQQGQRPVLISALNPSAPNDPATLPLTPIGVNYGAQYTNGFDDSPTRAQMALGPQDSVSAITGRSSPRRRSRLRSEDPSEDRLRAIEIRESIDEQIEDKLKRAAAEEEEERREAIRIERDRKRIDQREEVQSEAERSKWKKLWETEQTRETKVLDALKKAEEEAKLVRKAKLRRHADRGKENNYDSMDGGLNGSSGFGYSEGEEGSSNMSRSMDAMERAREEAEQIARREQVDREEMKRHMEYKRAEAAKAKAKTAVPDRSQSQPPPQYRSPTDARPIKPQTEDPLQIWENYAQKLAAQRESDTRQSRRATPTRQSMRVKSNRSEMKKVEDKDNKRADSLERIPNKHKEPEVEQKAMNQLKPAIQIRPATVVISRNTNGPLRPEATEPAIVPPGKNKARTRRTGNAAELLLAAGAGLPGSLESPDTSVTSKPPKSDRSREKKKILKTSSSPSRKSTLDTSPKRVNGLVSPSRGLSPQRKDILNGSLPSLSQKTAKKTPKLLKKRPSLDRMLQPAQSGSDSEAVDKTSSDNPWGDQLGGDNPLFQPIKTRRKKKSTKEKNMSNGDLSLLDSSLSISNNLNNQSSDSASLRSQTDVEVMKPRLRSSSLLNLNSTAAKERSSKLRIEKDDNSDPTTSVRPTANIETFNARSPLYSSIRVKRDKPTTERQQKILEQLSNLRQQLKDKQKQVESSFEKSSKITRETEKSQG